MELGEDSNFLSNQSGTEVTQTYPHAHTHSTAMELATQISLLLHAP